MAKALDDEEENTDHEFIEVISYSIEEGLETASRKLDSGIAQQFSEGRKDLDSLGFAIAEIIFPVNACERRRKIPRL